MYSKSFWFFLCDQKESENTQHNVCYVNKNCQLKNTHTQTFIAFVGLTIFITWNDTSEAVP